MLFRDAKTVVCFLLLLILFPWTAFATAADEKEPSSQKKPQYSTQIYYIVIDGLQGSALKQAQAPNINGVASSGIRINYAIPVFPPSVEASVASLLTGSEPSLHKFPGKELAGTTILDLLHKKKLKVGFWDGTGRLKPLAKGGSYRKVEGDDKAVIKAAIEDIKKDKPYFSLIVLDDLRKILDNSGPNSQAYLKALTQTDNNVGILLHYLHQEGVFEQSLVVIAGTTGKPPVIIKGPRFKCGATLPPISLIDVAPTIANLLGEKMLDASGLVLWNAFDPGSFQDGLYLMEQRIKDLSNAHVLAFEKIHQLLRDKKEVEEEQKRIAREKENTTRAIEERDAKIAHLEQKINFLKIVILVLIVLFTCGYFAEYRYLRKKFLLF